MTTPSLLVALAVAAGATPGPRHGAATCQPCHARETPAIVRIWSESAHARAKVGCAACHGEDGARNHPGPAGGRAAVDAAVCGKCHEKATREHLASKHGIGLRAGQACTRDLPGTAPGDPACAACHVPGSAEPRTTVQCARFLAQTAAMQRQGCTACHAVEGRCDTCHGAHHTDAALARKPEVCGTCHMGPDHAQYEMWQTSRHGAVHAVKGLAHAPDCVTCHMPGKTHDVGVGITMDFGGKVYAKERRDRERGRMLDVCAGCHTRDLAARSLADGDAVQRESKAVLDEAAGIVKELDRQGLLDPAPAARPPNPVAGARLELGAHMLYEDLSRAEAIYFDMKKFFYVTAWKGVFHQNPAWAHWRGNAPLKLGLSHLRSELALLRKVRLLEDRLRLATPDAATPGDPAGQGLREELRALQERRVRGELDDAALERAQREVLERSGR